MVITTNPKHTPPTRNHPTDKQTPPHYKAKKPNATTKPSEARPASPTHNCQSRTDQDHHHSTTYSGGQNAAKSKTKAVPKAHTAQIPTSLPKIKPPCESAPPQTEDPQYPNPRKHARQL
ncbi:hypothetical protein ATANTOWER_024383 [Ataeniobius toweri]|uniref:Uncharacterized protein n=1 Tax=Ataeniobius toweri TaxID=208326 RepID=A0ABU7AHR2_9TELE|nr:hypothetical protein [Ataeniobius toweri]